MTIIIRENNKQLLEKIIRKRIRKIKNRIVKCHH